MASDFIRTISHYLAKTWMSVYLHDERHRAGSHDRGSAQDLHVFCEKPPGRDLEDVAQVVTCERECPHLKLKYLQSPLPLLVWDALRLIDRESLGYHQSPRRIR